MIVSLLVLCSVCWCTHSFWGVQAWRLQPAECLLTDPQAIISAAVSHNVCSSGGCFIVLERAGLILAMVYQAKILFLSLLVIGSWRLVVKNSTFLEWFELPSRMQEMGLPKKLPTWLKQPLHYYVILYFMLGVLLYNSLHDTVKIMRQTDFMDASWLSNIHVVPPFWGKGAGHQYLKP